MSFFQDFFSLLFPHFCFTCRQSLAKGEEYVCSRCLFELPKTNYHEEGNHLLERRFYGIIDINYALAYLKFIKSGKVQVLLKKLKYENCPQIGDFLGKRYATELLETGFEARFDLIVPVPLHKTKQRQRGYNQSDGFARGLAETFGTAWSPLVLKRMLKNESQTRKNRLERYRNVDGIFKVVDKAAVENKRVLLVDDVVTTGATMEACARPLLQHGCKELSMAAIAAAQ